MKAQLITKFGDPSVLELAEISKPDIKPGHVLIKIMATSVNQIDCKIRSGVVPAISPDFPAILQGDFAGTVDAVASDVTSFKVGDEVFGCAGGLKGSGGVGGVGHIAIQLAKWCGAKVYTTVLKNEDFSLAKSFGADEVINAKEESTEKYVMRLTHNRGFDVVFDTVGGPNLDKSLIAASINGSVVTTVARSTHDLTPMHNKALSLHVVFMLLPILNNTNRETHGKILQEIADIVDKGKLKPLIDPHRFTLETASDAHALLESGKAHGKVVISVV